MIDHEEQTIKAFMLKERRDRYLFFLGNNKRRKAVLDRLNHCKDFDERFMQWLPSNADIVNILLKAGSPSEVYVISDSIIDGKTMTLSDAIHETSMTGSGTIVSCIPGKLAYYYDEVGERRGILKRS
jgi:hypothetical protein